MLNKQSWIGGKLNYTAAAVSFQSKAISLADNHHQRIQIHSEMFNKWKSR